MGLLRRIYDSVRSTLRYKLLALGLLPILLLMPVALALAVWWGSRFTYEQLYIKVNTDLSVAHDAFERARQDYLARLQRLGESYRFQTSLEISNSVAIARQLEEIRRAVGFSYLEVTDLGGRRLHTATPGHTRSSALRIEATQGQAVAGVEVFSARDLAAASPDLAEHVRLPLLETPRARPTERTEENRGMMIRAIYPVRDSSGGVVALLDGGVLLNRNFAFVDGIRDLVYGPGSLPEGSIGTVTVFLDDVRISTNVPLRPGERALGTRVSDEVRTEVLDRGRTWLDRAFVVNDWYISAYEPIVDVDGGRVGMLYAGYLEAPYRSALLSALSVLVLLFLVLMGLSALLAIRGAKSIFSPVEAMSRVIRATRAGEDQRIGPVHSLDELGELAREFDAMLDLLKEKNRAIQQAADELELKVARRTAELSRRNADLSHTIRVLRQTRQQLVMAEKLAALGELTAGVAHEINNPTAVMLGNLDNVIAELGAAAEPVREELELVVEQIYRIKEIIDNLLQYARPDQYAGYLSEVDVNRLARRTVKLVQHLRKRHSFELVLALEAVTTVEVSEHELQQVLINLLVNAIHALPEEGGRIELASRDWDGRGVVIQVRDNGHGIPADRLNQVFNPFFSTKGQGEGSGLGLSVSYGLVRRYGGTITVRSAPGEGSEFSVYLLRTPELHEDEETIAEQLSAVEQGPAGAPPDRSRGARHTPGSLSES